MTAATAARDVATDGLSVRDLHVHYGERHAVRGVSFSVAPGSTLAIVGESGCGKTSSALAVARLLPAGTLVQGSAVVGDLDLG
ncbi:MAG: ATP-binding cassette domain-containing protein, partial [Trebonia sp.]